MKVVWWGVIALSVAAMLRVWWFWSGPCMGTAEEMSCRLAPNATWPVAIGASVLAVGAIALAAVMLSRRTPDPTAHPA